ncbi:aspartate/glutamate racemase family protein [Aurantiacibacter sp. MUD61]|uniref:aspartate/glutamate racemase family protein n=1 Tax=Aurantiacibacter sp. MUD61 TaxID=3009083 RepID=UPI0022F09FE9|nr:amino acid racemase [Aurantiacibacter sp. MUD61]
MRKLGMIGGMSWVSTHRYYERINRQIQRDVDPRASAPLLIESLDFAQIYQLDTSEDWQRGAKVLIDSAKRLANAGAEQLIICANSMHKVYREVQAEVDVPILHIAECVGERMAADGVKQAALIGSRNVMTEGFYRRRLVAHGVDLLPPEMGDADELNRIIYEELMVGKARKDSERTLKSMFSRLENDGAKAIVLANTELELLVDVNANVLPIYDCMRIHADAAAKWIIGG